MKTLAGPGLFRSFARLESARPSARDAVIARRAERLRETPAGFFRGTPSLFYARCVDRGIVADDSIGGGEARFLVGDVHLENVGAFAYAPGRFTFDFNDLDEAVPGPCRLDVLRGAAATMIAAQTRGLTLRAALAATESFVQGYLRKTRPPALPALQRLVRRAADRPARDWIDARCPKRGGARVFLTAKGYLPLEEDEVRVVEGLFRAFREAPPAGLGEGPFELEAAAFRVQGCASLGVRRFALLVHGPKVKGRGPNETRALLLDAKQVRASAVVTGGAAKPKAGLKGPNALRAGEAGRVEDAMNALLPRLPLGARSLRGLDGADYLVRVHAPGEDKLALVELDDPAEVNALARIVGAQLARAHARTVTDAKAPPLDPRRALEAALDLASESLRAYQSLLLSAP